MTKKIKTIKIYEEDHKKISLKKINEDHKTLADTIHKIVEEAKI